MYDELFIKIVHAMEEKFRKYYENMTLIFFSMATVMDPQVKLFGVQFAIEEL